MLWYLRTDRWLGWLGGEVTGKALGREERCAPISLSLVFLTLNHFMMTVPEMRRSKAFLISIMFQTTF